MTSKNYISRGTFFLCKTRALFGALRTLKSEYTVIQAQTLCESSQRGDATTQKHLPSDLRQPLSRTWQLRFATTAQAIRNSSYGLPLTRGGTRRCLPAKSAAAPRCWDSPAKDGLYHAHCARGGDKYGVYTIYKVSIAHFLRFGTIVLRQEAILHESRWNTVCYHRRVFQRKHCAALGIITVDRRCLALPRSRANMLTPHPCNIEKLWYSIHEQSCLNWEV